MKGGRAGWNSWKAPKGIGETFKKPADAIGDLNGEAKLVGEGTTKNDFWTQRGFTKTEYYTDSNGTKWAVFKNPKTGEYFGFSTVKKRHAVDLDGRVESGT